MILKRTTPPASEFISVADAALQVFGDATFDSVKLTRDIKAVIRFVETYTERAFINQTWTMTLPGFPKKWKYNEKGAIFLPKGQTGTVTSLKYRDVDGVEVTLVEDTHYRVITSSPDYGVIEPLQAYTNWYSTSTYFTDAVEVVWVCGEGASLNATEFSEVISGCMILIGELYASRQINIPGNYTESMFYKMFFDQYKIYKDFTLHNQNQIAPL